MMRQNFIVFAEKWKWTTKWSNEIFLKKEQQIRKEKWDEIIYIYQKIKRILWEIMMKKHNEKKKQKNKTRSKSIRFVRKMKTE